MREVRVPLTQIQPGEMVVRIGNREVNQRFRGLEDCRPGQRVRGPRGGAYALTAAGAAEYAVAVLYSSRPIVKRAGHATVLRAADDA